jgi:hypothetical protein
MVGSAIGVKCGSCYLCGEALRYWKYPICIYGNFLCKTSPATKRKHALTQLQSLYLIAQFHDSARHLSSRRKGQLGGKLVLILDDQDIWKIYSTGLHGNQHLLGTRNRPGDVLHLQGIRKSKLGTYNCFHGREFLPKAWRYKRRKKEGKLARKG